MRVRSLMIATALLATACFGTAAQAASTTKVPGETVSINLSSLFTPTMTDSDGSAYGVRERAKSELPTIQILGGSTLSSGSLTPDPCNSSGNFPGGWCQSAHSVAASTFGWNFSQGGAGVIIGMVDTGIDLNSPEFAGRVLQGYCVVSAVNPCTSANDQAGGDLTVFPGGDSTHGTHTAGIAAGANVGIADQASILPVKVCGSNVDSCDGVDTGIVWASAHGASVISVSIGGPVLAASDVTALATAVSNGALLVVAAGNSGNKDPVSGYLGGAALDNGIRGSMIVVGATGCNGPNSSVPTNCANGGLGGIATFSQVPGNQCTVSGGQRYCMKDYFVVAPGVDIWSSVGNGTNTAAEYGYLSGTSMATPYVSGVAAVIKGAWPYLTSSEIANIIFNTTDDMGAVGIDPVYGRGEVDITKALAPAPDALVAVKGVLAGNTLDTQATVQGASGAQQSLAMGPLSVAVQNSKLLKNAVVVDSYGRNFTANLTKAGFNQGFDFTPMLLSNQFTNYAGFGFSTQSPIGNLQATGYSVDTTTPRLLSSEFRTDDYHQYNVRDLQVVDSLAPGWDVDFGYNMDQTGQFTSYGTQSSPAYDGLFMSAAAVNSPYASLTNGGDYLGTNVTVADGVHVHFGQSMLNPQHAEFQAPEFAYLAQLEGPQMQYDQRAAQTSMAGADWDFASWGGLGLVATQTSEQNGILGGLDSGAMAIAKAANTSAIGTSARVGFGNGWVTTVSYSEGITNLDLRSDSIVSQSDPLHSRSYGLAIAKRGVFDEDNNDSIGFAVTRPIQVYAGGVEFQTADGVDTDGNLLVGREHDSLASQTPETDIELGYVTSFMNGALSLQANAGYQMNLDGQSGTNAISVISRAKINF